MRPWACSIGLTATSEFVNIEGLSYELEINGTLFSLGAQKSKKAAGQKTRKGVKQRWLSLSDGKVGASLLVGLKRMNFPLPIPFAPNADSEAVEKLRQRLSVKSTPISLRVTTAPEERAKSCYANVQNRIERRGGSMRLGWAVWQHSNLFIEAERHAVYDPGNGGELLDCTPHILPDETECSKILFIPNDRDIYNPASDYVPDNVRVPLMDDPRIAQALNLFSQKTALMNSVPGVDVALPPNVVRAVAETELKASMLLLSVIQSSDRKGRVGRNDPCPCGSGKKHKRCHGR